MCIGLSLYSVPSRTFTIDDNTLSALRSVQTGYIGSLKTVSRDETEPIITQGEKISNLSINFGYQAGSAIKAIATQNYAGIQLSQCKTWIRTNTVGSWKD